MVRIFWEVSITRMIVLLLSIVTLYMVSWVVSGVFVMVNTRKLVQVIVVRVRHGIVKVEKIMIVTILKVLMLAIVPAIFVIVVVTVLLAVVVSIKILTLSVSESVRSGSDTSLQFSLEFALLCRLHIFLVS